MMKTGGSVRGSRGQFGMLCVVVVLMFVLLFVLLLVCRRKTKNIKI